MKKLFFLSLLVSSSLIFSACMNNSAQNPSANSPSTGAVPAAAEKSGETTKTGKIVSAGGIYFLETSAGQRQKLDSYSIDLSAYVNQTVTVTGQFSGDELFVGSVK